MTSARDCSNLHGAFEVCPRVVHSPRATPLHPATGEIIRVASSGSILSCRSETEAYAPRDIRTTMRNLCGRMTRLRLQSIVALYTSVSGQAEKVSNPAIFVRDQIPRAGGSWRSLTHPNLQTHNAPSAASKRQQNLVNSWNDKTRLGTVSSHRLAGYVHSLCKQRILAILHRSKGQQELVTRTHVPTALGNAA